MITCNILYEDDSELEQVEYLRSVLSTIHRKRFYFSSRTFKHKPIPELRIKDMDKERGKE